MRSLILAAAVLVGVVATSSSASAQVYVPAAGTPLPGGIPVYSTWYVTPSFGATPVFQGGTYFPPYDYYAAFPKPARIYSGFGDNDFPFYGKPYGHPSTPWNWNSLGSYPAYSTRATGFSYGR